MGIRDRRGAVRHRADTDRQNEAHSGADIGGLRPFGRGARRVRDLRQIGRSRGKRSESAFIRLRESARAGHETGGGRAGLFRRSLGAAHGGRRGDHGGGAVGTHRILSDETEAKIIAG